jgi:hypothetical protein
MHDKQGIVSAITDCAVRFNLHCDGLRSAGRRNERPSFTGTWRLNRELSDKPQEKAREGVGKTGQRLDRPINMRFVYDAEAGR